MKTPAGRGHRLLRVLGAIARVLLVGLETGLSSFGALSGQKPHPGPVPGPDRRPEYRP